MPRHLLQTFFPTILKKHTLFKSYKKEKNSVTDKRKTCTAHLAVFANGSSNVQARMTKDKGWRCNEDYGSPARRSPLDWSLPLCRCSQLLPRLCPETYADIISPFARLQLLRHNNFFTAQIDRFLSNARTCIDEDSSLEKENWLSESLISSTLALNMPLLLFFLQTGLKQLRISEHQCAFLLYV